MSILLTVGTLLEALQKLISEGVDPETQIVSEGCSGNWGPAGRVEYKPTTDLVAVYRARQ